MTGQGEPEQGEFELIFNVGSRRSGTYWLQRIVGAHPDVAPVPSETHLYSHGLAPLFERFQHDDPGDPTVGLSFLPRARLARFGRELALASFEHCRRNAEPRVAERTPFHVRHLPLITELHPDARIVHIIRDGRDVARSLTKHEWGPGSVAEAAAEWRDSVAAGRAASLDSSVYRELRYEVMRAAPAEEITDLFAWLGLGTSPGEIEPALAAASETANLTPGSAGQLSTGRWRSEWEAADLAAFMDTAGDLLEELGYREDQ